MSTKLALVFALFLAACSGPAGDGAPNPVSSTSPQVPAPRTEVLTTQEPAAHTTPLMRGVGSKRGPRAAADVLASEDQEAFNEMAGAMAAQKQALGAKKTDCISKGLALDNGMHGHVELQVRLNADGTVRDAEVVSNRNLPPAVVACIRNAVKETRFLPPATPREFTRSESAGIP
jgi:outer membrane biosynthesis protein TonB